MARTTKADIEHFLKFPRVAVVGLSRDKGHFSRDVARELIAHQYDVVPVNPLAEEIEGRRCFHSLAEVEPPPQAALIMTAPKQTAAVVEECGRLGIAQVWLYRSVGAGSVSKEAVEACERLQLKAVVGECPMMWLAHPKAGFVHGLHKGLRQLTGALPK